MYHWSSNVLLNVLKCCEHYKKESLLLDDMWRCGWSGQ